MYVKHTIVVAGLVEMGGEAVLLKEADGWVLPYGYLGASEVPAQALGRELSKRLGSHFEVQDIIGVYTDKKPNGTSLIVVVYKAYPLEEGFQIKDSEAVEHFDLDSLPALSFGSHKEAVEDFRCRYRNPTPTVDVIIEYQGGIVLIQRKNPPYGWALPGGYVDYGESLENAAIREAKEETNLKLKALRQFRCYSDPQRDPRGHTVTTVFTALGKGTLKAKDDAKALEVFTKDNLPQELAFDHGKIIQDYFSLKKDAQSRESHKDI